MRRCPNATIRRWVTVCGKSQHISQPKCAGGVCFHALLTFAPRAAAKASIRGKSGAGVKTNVTQKVPFRLPLLPRLRLSPWRMLRRICGVGGIGGANWGIQSYNLFYRVSVLLVTSVWRVENCHRSGNERYGKMVQKRTVQASPQVAAKSVFFCFRDGNESLVRSRRLTPIIQRASWYQLNGLKFQPILTLCCIPFCA